MNSICNLQMQGFKLTQARHLFKCWLPTFMIFYLCLQCYWCFRSLALSFTTVKKPNIEWLSCLNFTKCVHKPSKQFANAQDSYYSNRSLAFCVITVQPIGSYFAPARNRKRLEDLNEMRWVLRETGIILNQTRPTSRKEWDKRDISWGGHGLHLSNISNTVT